jgi:hypothetical protein
MQLTRPKDQGWATSSSDTASGNPFLRSSPCPRRPKKPRGEHKLTTPGSLTCPHVVSNNNHGQYGRVRVGPLRLPESGANVESAGGGRCCLTPSSNSELTFGLNPALEDRPCTPPKTRGRFTDAFTTGARPGRKPAPVTKSTNPFQVSQRASGAKSAAVDQVACSSSDEPEDTRGVC